jgi:hypothetical protein
LPPPRLRGDGGESAARKRFGGIIFEADLEQAVVAFDDNVGAGRRLGRLCRVLPARAREADAIRISVMA